MPDKYYEERLEDMEKMRFALDEETGAQRMKRKFREEPFVPAGQPDTYAMRPSVALTCFALVAATVGIKQGRREYANNMMRLRGTRLWNYISDNCAPILTFNMMNL
ncbi:hypothetical protein INT44_005080 [Umbelopsis vinacea]|uniref:HIG1 domain-containing protein n=1 Tax=Umbelopsis vinacea TaxID=44442 RepID=A0A8H7Q7D3_9FUNG|nr:hypothetical protein INT44_005080 [Umbelopsis vinacea]